MAFIVSSDVVSVVWRMDIALFLTILLLLLLLIAWRGQLQHAAQHQERLRAVWEPLLIASLEEVPSSLPRVRRRDWLTWFRLWNYFSESLKDPVRENLNHLTRAAAMDEVALRLLQRGRQAEKLVVITTLGQLRETRAWEALWRLAQHKEPLLSLTAAKALLRIDAVRALPLILTLIAKQEEWSASGIATILKEVGPEELSQPLIAACLDATAQEAPRLIRYLSLVWPEYATPAIRQLLSTTQEPEVLTACLKVCQSPDVLETVRQCLQHPHWQVRLHAVHVLARLGTEDDVPRVLICLEDEEWWVRYRAAQALARLPGITPERLDALTNTQSSPFARDILRQVQSEYQLSLSEDA